MFELFLCQLGKNASLELALSGDQVTTLAAT